MRFRYIVYLTLLLTLAGCATLPSSGPTGGQIEKSAMAPKDGAPSIRLVQVDTISDVPGTGQPIPSAELLPELAPHPTDMVGPGDVLTINIYEAGVALFSGGGTPSAAGELAATPGVQMQKLPPMRVDDSGDITIPYAGTIKVAGLTITQAEARIRNSLKNLSQNPQVLITMNEPITNTIIVGGEVARPGRLLLQTNHETLSDIIALAGGYRGNVRDLTVRITRAGKTVYVRMNDLSDNLALDVRACPGDRVTLISNPRSYSVLGASGRVEQTSFAASRVSLAEAIASSGGTSPGIGNPAAVFVFRYIIGKQNIESPVVYHIDMMKTNSYFLAQRFAMQDKDVLYFGNAAANQPSKLIQLISQLFSPILTVTSAVQTVQASRN